MLVTSVTSIFNTYPKYSAQKGKCAIFGLPLEMGGVVVLHIDPYKGKDIGRYHNLMLVGVTASGIVNEPDPSEARSMLAGYKVGQESHEDHKQTSQQTEI